MGLKTLGGLTLDESSYRGLKPLLVLAFLSIEGPRSRRELADLFWLGAKDPRGSLSVAMRQLKNAAGDVIQADPDRVWSTVACDATELLTHLERGEIQDAVALYEGPFLECLSVPLGVELEEWVYGTREYLAGRTRSALVRHAEADAGRGDFEAAGRRAEEAYDLAGAPEPELDELERIYLLLVAGANAKAGEVRREAASLGVTLDVTMGAAREKLGVGATQVGRATRNNLPAAGTSFVGRDAELLNLAKFLDRNDDQLLTLTGPGGVGKTRLALQLARDSVQENRFADGVVFVPLDALDTPMNIPTSIAAALGRELPGNSEPVIEVTRFIGEKQLLLLLDNYEHLMEGAVIAGDLVRACPNLTVVVTSRERLNLEEEHVFSVSGLPLPPKDDKVEELGAADALTLLVQRAKKASLNFSLTRAMLPHAVKICRLVDGSPLGIELAAAWVRTVPLVEIAAEIETHGDFLASTSRNASERHRSLRAVFLHSWGLLEPEEQAVFRKLAVFRGGFRRDAAGAVAGATLPMLVRLVDKSLLRASPEGRYDLHALTHEFARERLAEHNSELTSAQERHAEFFFQLAEAAEPHLRSQGEWLDRLEEEHDNLQAVLSWSLEHDRMDLGLRLASFLGGLWTIRGYYPLGHGWFTQILDHPRSQDRSKWRAVALRRSVWLMRRPRDISSRIPRIEESIAILREIDDKKELSRSLTMLGSLTYYGGDYSSAEGIYTEGLEVARKAGDAYSTALNLHGLGTVKWQQGDHAAARVLLQECMSIAEGSGDKRGISFVLQLLGVAYSLEGDFTAAREHFARSLGLFQELGDADGTARTLHGLGDLACSEGKYAEARAHLEDSLGIRLELEDLFGIGECLESYALVLFHEGRIRRAVHLWGSAEAVREATRSPMLPVQLNRFGPSVEESRMILGAESFAAIWVEGHRLSVDRTIEWVLSREAPLGEAVDRPN